MEVECKTLAPCKISAISRHRMRGVGKGKGMIGDRDTWGARQTHKEKGQVFYVETNV